MHLRVCMRLLYMALLYVYVRAGAHGCARKIDDLGSYKQLENSIFFAGILFLNLQTYGITSVEGFEESSKPDKPVRYSTGSALFWMQPNRQISRVA